MFWDSDYLTLSEITFEWGDSYDDKDWVRLRAILAPTLMVKDTSLPARLDINAPTDTIYP